MPVSMISNNHEQLNKFDLQLKEDAVVYGEISIENGIITISKVPNESKINLDVLTKIPDPYLSEINERHEIQHQYNGLFLPIETNILRYGLMSHLTEGSLPPEEIIKLLIHGLVRLERRWILYDTVARGEILAHYRDGRHYEDILDIMTNSPLYDYKTLYKEKIEEIPERVKTELQKEIKEVLYEDKDEGRRAVYSRALQIDKSTIKEYVDHVFDKEYSDDLKRWIDSIAILESKGYNRDEIISILCQSPVNAWQGIAKRVDNKSL